MMHSSIFIIPSTVATHSGHSWSHDEPDSQQRAEHLARGHGLKLSTSAWRVKKMMRMFKVKTCGVKSVRHVNICLPVILTRMNAVFYIGDNFHFLKAWFKLIYSFIVETRIKCLMSMLLIFN